MSAVLFWPISKLKGVEELFLCYVSISRRSLYNCTQKLGYSFVHQTSETSASELLIGNK